VKVENNPFIDSRLYLQWIPEISGWGVYAKELIEANSIIERSPIIVYPRDVIEMSYYVLQGEGKKSHEFVIDQYSIFWEGNCGIALGWVSLYNHSDRNNSEFQPNFSNTTLEIRTTREIMPNEQLTVNYGASWFSAKGYIKKVDF
jgi:SET domain-containing protein